MTNDKYVERKKSNYSVEIDGLRGIAVGLVVLFHFFPDNLSGGYIGVDIFFVISGFLITQIILKEKCDNNFNFLGFYTRRVLRIFPALTIVVASSILFGWFALFADEYQLVGQHIQAAVIFLYNYYLLLESGYFDVTSFTKPMLHLWSLSIELQFYVVWPLIFVWFINKKLTYFGTFCIIAFSILWGVFVTSDSVTLFYSLSTRFWDF